MGTKRGAGRGSFIDSVLAAIDGFYGAVAEQITPWTARAPQLPRGVRTAAEQSGLDLEPPPLDRADEPLTAELLVGRPDEDPPEEVVHAVEQMPGELAAPVMNSGEGDSMVSWDGADQRLEHERRSDEAGV